MCGIRQHIRIDDMKTMADLICSKFTADKNYNSTVNNVYVLQMLELLKNLDAYLDYSYDEAREKFAEYITIHGIKRSDVDTYIRKYPLATFKFYYELGLEHVLA